MEALQPTLDEWLIFHQKPMKMKGSVEFRDCDAAIYDHKGIFFSVEWKTIGPYPSTRPIGFSGHASDIHHGRRRAYQYIHNSVETIRGQPGKDIYTWCRRKVVADVKFPCGRSIRLETHFDESITYFFKDNDLLRRWTQGLPRSFFHEE